MFSDKTKKTNSNPILIVPINDGNRFYNFDYFTSEQSLNINPATFTIKQEIFSPSDTLQLYNHIGKYTISASSYNDKYSIPENAFNYGSKGWKSNNNINTGSNEIITSITKTNKGFKSNQIINKQSNYSQVHFGPSYYNNTNNARTPDNKKNTYILGNSENEELGSNKHNIKGEWLQIKLPEPIFLYNYTITVPSPSLNDNDNLKDYYTEKQYKELITPSIPNYSKNYTDKDNSKYYVSHFPKVFTLAGSIDGSNWHYVDHQSFGIPPDLSYTYLKENKNTNLFNGYIVDTNNGSTKIQFQVNSIDHFSWFRLIINEMFPGNQYVEINEWDIYAFVDIITPNSDTLKPSYFNDISLNKTGSIESFSPSYNIQFDILKTNSQEYLTGMNYNWDYLTNNIDNGLMNLYREQLTNINDAKKDKLPHLEGFSCLNKKNTLENFESHEFIVNKGENTSRNNINENQITPLNYIYKNYANLQEKVNTNYIDISQNIISFNKKYNDALNDPKDKYDMKANNFNKPPTRIDGWINDNKEIVLEQNYIFILSTITITTLAIAIIFISK